MSETTTDVHERAREALDGMRERVQHRDPDGCHNVMADLWRGYGIEFTCTPNEFGVHVLPGLHDDRFRFLAEHPALNVAYEALEVAARKFMPGRGITDDDLLPDASLLESLFADFDEGSGDPLIGEGDLLEIIAWARLMVPPAVPAAFVELRDLDRRGAR